MSIQWILSGLTWPEKAVWKAVLLQYRADRAENQTIVRLRIIDWWCPRLTCCSAIEHPKAKLKVSTCTRVLW